ncbi:MAG: hypothetical protein CVV49_18245 [Spirochaetae bacterium HGW-Spirochaetae-5]|nr:MAG: hypothetical protein CVV49_18245 [Spirochaetae bacterium HGW-Spirochaetae-5]
MLKRYLYILILKVYSITISISGNIKELTLQADKFSVYKKMIVILIIAAVSLPAPSYKYMRVDTDKRLETIAFGSCGHQDKPQPVLDLISDIRPDLFIYLGDNVYNDSYQIKDLPGCYSRLGSKPEFIRLKDTADILAIWDDHDYGWNDSGNDYPFKEKSKQIFLDFFGIPEKEILRRKGIYYSKLFTDGKHKVQIIMLDLRTFRDRLLPYKGEKAWIPGYQYRLDYSPHLNKKPAMLGEEQWAWLQKQLRLPADLRIIASSTQFGVSYNGYESWANFPHEQKRLLDLIKSTRAEGVIFISGDVHYGEISLIEEEYLYPIYDITSSGITSTWPFSTPNLNRIAGPVMENNFGLITIDWDRNDPEITIQIRDVNDDVRINWEFKISHLKFK